MAIESVSELSIGGKRPYIPQLLLTNLKLRLQLRYLRFKLFYLGIKVAIFNFQCARREKGL